MIVAVKLLFEVEKQTTRNNMKQNVKELDQ